MNYVVIDKSYLQSAKPKELHEIAEDNKLLLTMALVYELFTAEMKRGPKEGIYKKLLDLEDSISFVGPVNDLIRYECENHCPCIPLDEQFEKFDPRLFAPEYNLSERQKRIIDFFGKEWENEVETFKILGSKVSEVLPELQTMNPGSEREKVQFVLEALASKPEKIKQIYKQIPLEYKPPPNLIDERWVFFRKTQIYLAYGVEYTRKFGTGKIEDIAKRFPNDVIDMEYLIIGILTGALATDDKDLKRFFSLFCPNGKLFHKLGQLN